MANEVQYRVKRQFKYGRKTYKQGDIWQPDGGRWDAEIISTGLVTTEPVKATAKDKAAKHVTQSG